MADRIVDVTTQSWGRRLGGSIKGVVVGLIMVALGVVMLFWNEGRAVRRAKALKEGAAAVISVDGAAPSPANEAKLVHFTGEARAEGTLRDVVFGVETGALKLERTVEMFQWREDTQTEERKKLGGGTETVTTYTYATGWSSHAIDSSSFREPEGHLNPQMPFESRGWTADPITIGDWQLTDSFVSKLSRDETLNVGEAERQRASDQVKEELRPHQGGFYLGVDPASPRVGDVRVRFEIVTPATVSVVGLQAGDQLIPYTARVGGSIALLSYGALGADQMFEAAKQANATFTWILRVVGFLVIAIGFRTILRPLTVLADVVPAFGRIASAGTGVVSYGLAALVSLVTIAVGWIFYRPLLGIVLLLAAGAVMLWIGKRLAARGPESQPAAAPPPPPPPAAVPPPPPPAG